MSTSEHPQQPAPGVYLLGPQHHPRLLAYLQAIQLGARALLALGETPENAQAAALEMMSNFCMARRFGYVCVRQRGHGGQCASVTEEMLHVTFTNTAAATAEIQQRKRIKKKSAAAE